MWASMPTCVVLQHVAPESAFAIEYALAQAGVDVDVRQVFAGDDVPAGIDQLDGLVIMGGPMSAVSDQGFPTRQAELALIGSAVRAGIPTLGVCLGAQLLAVAAGAAVYQGELGPEIGWSPVTLTDDCDDDRLLGGLARSLTVLQWHGDTFDLPAGAVHLVVNSIYPNQAFRLHDAAWGLQFHLEVTAAAVGGFLEAFASDLHDRPGGAGAIRDETEAAVTALAPARDLVLARFGALVAARVSTADLVSEL
jgi:GMP synthase-like glutamine amidotransferase